MVEQARQPIKSTGIENVIEFPGGIGLGDGSFDYTVRRKPSALRQLRQGMAARIRQVVDFLRY